MPYTKEQLLETYKKLPEDVKDAIFSVDTSEIIREIGEKNKLMIDKIGELADETGLVMLGLTHPNQFINNLTERLEVEHDIAKEIAEDINSKVFYPIRENLKKIHGIEKVKEEISKDRPLEIPKDGPLEPAPEIPSATQPAPTLVESEVGPPAGEAGVPTPPAPIESSEPTEDIGKITTPPVIMSMPIDLTKAGKTPAEGGVFSPPADFETKTKEEFFRSLEKKIEVPSIQETPTFKEVGVPTPPKTDVGVKKVDPYKEQLP